MKIKHFLGKENWNKEVKEGRSFLLGNKLGDYLWLSDAPESRYQGWFISSNKDKEKVYKIIEDIRPVDRNQVKVLENYFSRVERKGDNFEEVFRLDENTNRFIYKTKSERKIELVLDMRDSYSDDYPDYEIEQLDEKIIIKSNNSNELFLAIRGFNSFEEPKERFVRNYKMDQKRNSPPFEKAVFKALILKGQKLIFSAAENKEDALNNLEKNIKEKSIKERREPVDFVSAEVGLNNLLVGNRIYAGFPWFFQFWQRDEAISLRGLNVINSKKAKDLFWSLLEDNSDEPGGSLLTDGLGWTFKRAFLFLNELSKEEEGELINYLREQVDFKKQGELIVTDKKETWMDSIPRKGARIEMQALQLSMYKLGKLIDEERGEKYEKLEKTLRDKVRDLFWDGNILADGYIPETDWVDKTVRPNIFLAYYIYPELLKEEEWKICFRRALYELWLEWGGLSTISKEDPRFKQSHTGENAESYHQGDSWFFVNNLAAIAMNRLDSGKFSHEVNQILKASREELLWKGVIGHHSELSSAEELRSEGAISQAWSFATYIEAMHEIFKIKNFNWD
ncbi:MAG: amylo-alpha-1,6-glucosidase [Patescibacteria group bacterium]